MACHDRGAGEAFAFAVRPRLARLRSQQALGLSLELRGGSPIFKRTLQSRFL